MHITGLFIISFLYSSAQRERDTDGRLWIHAARRCRRSDWEQMQQLWDTVVFGIGRVWESWQWSALVGGPVGKGQDLLERVFRIIKHQQEREGEEIIKKSRREERMREGKRKWWENESNSQQTSKWARAWQRRQVENDCCVVQRNYFNPMVKEEGHNFM